MTSAGRQRPGAPAVPAGRSPLLIGLSLAALLAGLAPVTAQSPKDDPRQRGEVAKQLDTSRDTLRQSERRVQSLQSDVQQLSAEQAGVNQQLIETGRLAQSTEARLSQIEARLGELDEQEKLIRGSLAARHDKMAKLFSAMQRMGRNPPPVIITRREDALQMVRSAMLLARAFPELKSQADELAGRLKDLVRVTTEIRSEGDRLKSETARLTEAKTRLAMLVESKRRSLGERQKELEEVRRSATAIARSVGDLSELIGKLDKAVAQHTALGNYDRELREREAQDAKALEAKAAEAKAAETRSNATAPPEPPAADPRAAAKAAAAPTVPPLRPTTAEPMTAAQSSAQASNQAQPPVQPAAKAAAPSQSVAEPAPKREPATQTALLGGARPPQIALEPQGAFSANPGRMKPAIPFHLAKGQLPLPVQGRRVLSFGDKNQFGRTSRGIVIETRPGGTVVSPSDGWVVYAGEFRSYGQVLIINAGGGYHILLANLARTEVEVGRFVLAGEPVGAMSSNVVAKNQDSAPVLYVEFRNKEGQSIDPAAWWADGSQKVQG